MAAVLQARPTSGLNPGTSVGFIPVKSATQHQTEVRERAAYDHNNTKKSNEFLIDRLSAHIEHCWEMAKRGKESVEREMLESLRQRNGEYDPTTLSEIRSMGGSEVYVLLTSTKCRAAEAWINDVLRPVSDYPFAIEPTPIAELPSPVMNEIKQEVYTLSAEIMQRAQTLGVQLQDMDVINELREYAKSRNDEALEKVQEEATDRSERMMLKITDQMAQGGWYDAFWAVVSDFVTLKCGVLKGPTIRNKKVQKWEQDPETGKWQIIVKKDFVPCYDRVSPFDLYPAPDSRHVNDGFLIERHKLSRQDIQQLIGVAGYREDKIRMVLEDYSQGHIERLPVDSERNDIELAGEENAEQEGEKIEAIEFWGAVSGKILKEWGFSDELDEALDYEVNAWKIGRHVIRAVLNPDKLGRKPYSVDSYERIAGSFWGRGVPDLMKDIQGVCNATARALVNNAGIASGPQVEVNLERCDDDEEIYPWKIWQSDNKNMSEQPAVRFFQPEIVVEPLMRVFQFFSVQSEDQTGVPRWAYGNTDVGGAGETSSGLHTLMNNASRGIKESISHIDSMIASAVERTYDYNMMYDDDETIKGDARVVARGSSSLMLREQQAVRMREFLQATMNPVDNEIVGYEGRAKLLREAAKGLGIDVIPEGKELKALVQKLEQQAAMQMAAQQDAAKKKGATPPAKSENLDLAGQLAGGVEANMMQNPKGQRVGA